MFIIAGLGNPTAKYAHSRHNVGFDTIDILAEKYQIKMGKSLFRAQVGRGTIAGEKVVLVKPLTFMNLSGTAIRPIVRFYKSSDAAAHAVLCNRAAVVVYAEPLRVSAGITAVDIAPVTEICRDPGNEFFYIARVAVSIVILDERQRGTAPVCDVMLDYMRLFRHLRGKIRVKLTVLGVGFVLHPHKTAVALCLVVFLYYDIQSLYAAHEHIAGIIISEIGEHPCFKQFFHIIHPPAP